MSFKTLQDYKTRNFPNGFSSVFESWFDIIHDYADKTDNDAIYWYNERANVGALAAALARNNITLIEEYSCTKGRGEDKSYGRTDIACCYRNEWYLAEAKLKWQAISSFSAIETKNITSPSCADARRSWHGDKGSVPIGITFVVPWIKPQYRGDITTLIKQFIAEIEEDEYCDFWAYCAPGRLREALGASGDYYPMVALLGKYAK